MAEESVPLMLMQPDTNFIPKCGRKRTSEVNGEEKEVHNESKAISTGREWKTRWTRTWQVFAKLFG
jgi:hypothetical protein